MVNWTENSTQPTIQETFCVHALNGIQQKMLYLVINIPLSIAAILGNFVIIVALRKVSSLHLPSRLLLSCLASTDLCVGLIAQPLALLIVLLNPGHSRGCLLLKISNIMGMIFAGVSLSTLAAISLDRLLALLLGPRYRQVVTLRKTQLLVATLWFLSVGTSMTFLYNFRTTMVIILIVLVLARYKNIVFTALWVQLTLVACYLPYGIVASIFSITGARTPFVNIGLALGLSLVFFNSTLNPVLYCWKNKEIRQAVKKTITKFCCPSD